MAKRRIGLDVDGVVANFAQAIIEAGNKLGIKHLPVRWAEFVHIYGGPDKTKEHQAFVNVWMKVREDEDFWDSIPPHDEDVPFLPDVYITARPQGTDTYLWLFMNDVPSAPVITVDGGSKVAAAQAAKLTHFLDDAPHNVDELRAAGIDCWLLDRPWNQTYETIYRVKTIAEFWNKANPII